MAIDEFSFEKYKTEDKERVEAELIKNTTTNSNPAPAKENRDKKTINFLDLPSDSTTDDKKQKEIIDRFMKEEPVSIPSEGTGFNSYLNLVLSPNLRELELMVRGLEYVKRFNPLTNRDEVILRKIPEHPLNERGINEIMSVLKIYSSPEIKLGRKRERDYYLSIQQVGKTIVRLIYKNLKNFGMDSQTKQRHAKTFCLAIIEIMDASFSRSIGGRENDLSRASEFRIEGTIDNMDPNSVFTKNKKDAIKN